MVFITHLLDTFSSYISELVYSWNTTNLIHLIQKQYPCGSSTRVCESVMVRGDMFKIMFKIYLKTAVYKTVMRNKVKFTTKYLSCFLQRTIFRDYMNYRMKLSLIF